MGVSEPVHEYGKESRELRSLPEIVERTSSIQEKLFRDEQTVLRGFVERVHEYQQLADESGKPVYIRYMYENGDPLEGEYTQIELSRNQNKQMEYTRLVSEQGVTAGPIFCVYPREINEVYYKNAEGYIRPAGIECTNAPRMGWIQDFLDKDKVDTYKGYDEIVTVPAPKKAVIDDLALNIFWTQLLRTSGDEDIRPFVCGYRDGEITLATPEIHSISMLRNLVDRGGFETFSNFAGLAMHSSLLADLNPIDAHKNLIHMFGQTVGISLLEGSLETGTVVEICDKKDPKSKRKLAATHEEEIAKTVSEALMKARIPKKSVIFGDVVELMHRIGLGIQMLESKERFLNVTIPEYRAILLALKEHGLDFVGKTLPYPSQMDSKLTPAIEAGYAGIPHPFTRLVTVTKNGVTRDEVANTGELFAADPMIGTFIKKRLTSTRQGVHQIPNTNAAEYIPEQEGSWIVMPWLELGDIERRLAFHPILGVFFAVDRKIQDRAALGDEIRNVRQSRWQSITLTPEQKAVYEEYLRGLDKFSLERACRALPWGEKRIDQIRDVYNEAGITPTFGIYAYDLLWNMGVEIGPELEQNPLFEFGLPFVSEMQDVCTFPDWDSLAKAFIGKIKEKYGGRNWVIPETAMNLMHILLYNAIADNVAGKEMGKTLQLDLNKILVPKDKKLNETQFVDIHHNRKKALADYGEMIELGKSAIDFVLR